MFGTKLRSWMEAHIVRSRKKKDRKKGEKGFDSNCNSPKSYCANRSPAPHQVHPVDTLAKNVDGIRLHGGAGYGPTVTTSSGASGGTSGSVNLSSPESAYSTGYSTDGTSPGASYPPEYYINIRTGTHYFHSNGNGNAGNNNNNNNNGGKVRPKRPPLDPTTEMPETLLANGRTAYKLGETRLCDATDNKLARDPRDGPLNKNVGTANGVGHAARRDSLSHPRRHLVAVESVRAESSYSSEKSRRVLSSVPTSMPPPLVVSPSIQSPRERSRIRTNPWLSANSSGSSTNGGGGGGGGNGGRSRRDDTSSSSGHKLNESSGSASDVNLNASREQTLARKDYRQGSLSAGRSPINQSWRIPPGMDMQSKMSVTLQRRASSSSSASNSSNEDDDDDDDDTSGSSVTRTARSSEDDVTLNEMMGKFDESYVYEKETDILSDSDPTDCEDYVDSLSDVDTGQDGGDENDPFENDFDYIDNGSFLDLDNLEYNGRVPNTGHCTYFTFTSELGRRGSRLRESVLRRKNKEDVVPIRAANIKNSIKRQSMRHKKLDDKQGEKRKKRISQRRKGNLEKYDDEAANLNRVLVERMLLKNSGFNQGSRSVGGTPICLRRKKHDINKNLSPMRLNDNQLVASPTIVESETVKRRSNSVSYVNGNIVRHQVTGSAYMTTFASEIALMEADKEADRKYRELIMEAENILVNMQRNQTTSPIVPSPSRRLHNGLANKRVELIKNTELNIEFALSKSRNSHPELQSGSIRDIEHTSPKRQFAQPCSPIRRFIERNAGVVSPKESTFYRHEAVRDSPSKSLAQARLRLCEQETIDRSRTSPSCNGAKRLQESLMGREQSLLTSRVPIYGPLQETYDACWKEMRTKSKEEGMTSSSSDSDERCDVRRRATLMTFRSVDMGPIKEGSSYCPQSEPVKRKVYAGSATYGRIQKTLGEHIMLRNSDGDTATDDTDDSRKSLKEKVAQLRQERLAAEANANAQDNQAFQQQLSQLRRQMLVQTIEGLKRSLEDQSATLKQTCLEPMLNDELS